MDLFQEISSAFNHVLRTDVLIMKQLITRAYRDGGRLLIIGNGGSAAIASHIANDFCKNGGIEALAFNDPVSLTCVTNDYGYPDMFSRQLDWHARSTDILIAISSSGRSANILNAVAKAQKKGMHVVTLSGFDIDNPLRLMGEINFYIPSHVYGVVEVAHLAILHSLISPPVGIGIS